LIFGLYKSSELNVFESQRGSEGAELGFLWACTGNDQFSIPRMEQFPCLEEDMNTLFRGKAPKKKNMTIRGSKRGDYLRLVEVGDDVNPLLGDSHLDMLGSLSLT
jgi:hypothetical protein